MGDFSGRESISRLFLVCPTDGMEQHIRKEFKGEAFFYTALGLYMDFDAESENELWQLIVEKNIDQVVFVSSFSNVFYNDSFDKKRRRNYPVDIALDITRKKDIKHPSFAPNIYLLAAKHLENQKHRLLSTDYLGYHLTQNKIPVVAYVYQPKSEFFCSISEIEKRGFWLDKISAN